MKSNKLRKLLCALGFHNWDGQPDPDFYPEPQCHWCGKMHSKEQQHRDKIEANRKEALQEMCSNNNSITRVEYLIASLEDVQHTCYLRKERGAVSMFDNLIRIAEDVKLSILKEKSREDHDRRTESEIQN